MTGDVLFNTEIGMKLFSSLRVNQMLGYHQVSNAEKNGSTNIVDKLKTVFAFIFRIACSVSSYALFPAVSLFCFDFVYHFHLQYLLGLVTVILFLGILFNLQDRLLYHPHMPPNSTLYVPFPTHVPFENVQLTTEDGEILRGFFLKSPNGDSPNAPTIVYFHGNAGNAGSPCSLPLAAKCGANVLTVDYRGYGKSTGCPSEDGLYLDGKACIEYLRLRNDIDPNKIVLFGHSMGGAVAIHLASKMHESDYRIAALIVENTFTSLPNAAKHIFRGFIPGLSKLPLCCHTNKFLSLEKISSVRVPILFICGEKDKIVDPRMTRTLHDASNNAHTILMRVPKGSHNDTWCVSKNYNSFIAAFLSKIFNETMHDVESSNRIPELLNDLPSHNVTLTWKCQIISD